MNNIILLTDSYKFSHFLQYPEKTQYIYSYFESRGGRFNEIVFFGLQYFIKKYLLNPVTLEDIEEAKSYVIQHMAGVNHFNENGWRYIVSEHNGKLPVVIKAFPEGSIVPNSIPLMTIENTDPNCYWLTNYLETLLVNVWGACTVATYSRECKKIINRFLEETGDPDGIPFKLHDFGCRGVTCPEQAGLLGTAHLVNFMGTDTVPALYVARKYYSEEMAGYSIPASEHSIICSYGQDNEIQAMRNMLDKYPNGLVACVSDTYNIYEACSEKWGSVLKDQIINRNGTLVIRPDSGNPMEVTLKVIEILGEKFGYEINKKGYKVLNPKVRMIQGDGVDIFSIEAILNNFKINGWSADNIAFGSGGKLLQSHDRDELKFAFKCSNATVNNEDREVYKNPITDPGKVSKKGRFKVIKINNEYRVCDYKVTDERDYLVEVYRNGELKQDYSLKEIRERAKI